MQRLLILLGVAALVSTCQIDTEDAIVISDVNDEFYLDIWEQLTLEGRQLQWHIRTIEDAECTDSELAHNYRETGTTISLAINSIIDPEDCTAGEQPLRDTLVAGQLANGVYDLSLSLRDAVNNSGQLIINPDYYELAFDKSQGILPLRRLLRRVPENLIWGYIRTQVDSLTEPANQLVSDIAELGSPASPQEGYYGYFTVNGDVLSPADDQLAGADSFAYLLDKDTSQLEALISTFRDQYPEGVEVKLFDWKGRAY